MTTSPHPSPLPSPLAASAYRADLDGLRAVAIGLVVVFQAFPAILPGGFVGVDIFLVMSGYLVTASLSELRRDGAGILRFYLRRVRRIVPSLMVVLAACLGLGWVLLLPGEFQQLGKHVAGGVGRVILPGPVPHWKPFLYQVVERKYRGQPPRRSWDNVQTDALRTDRLMRDRFAGATEVAYISLIEHLCDAEGCLVYLGDDPLAGLTTYDYGHFTLPMSDYVARTLLAPAIVKALAPGAP